MIKVYYNRLENNKIEMTQDMLTDILSYTKRQENYIKRLKEDYMMLQNASDEVEEEKDKEIEVLKYIIKDVYSSIHHELHGHILHHDEDSWNLEYYTNDKLDYRKLLIALLSDYENRLIRGIDKDEN